MFLINSRLGLFSATPTSSESKSLHQQGPSFSRSYGGNLPSSLTRVLPRTLGFSPRLPVSVYGTGTILLPRSFSWQCGVSNSGSVSFTLVILLRLHMFGICLKHTLPAQTEIQYSATLILLRHSISQTLYGGAGISTCCPSPTHLPPRLRSRLTLSRRSLLRNP